MPSDRRWSDADRELVRRAWWAPTDPSPGPATSMELERVEAVLDAVVLLVAARVREQVAEELDATLRTIRESLVIGLDGADLDGAGGRQRVTEWADFIDREVRAAIARAHRTTPEAEATDG